MRNLRTSVPVKDEAVRSYKRIRPRPAGEVTLLQCFISDKSQWHALGTIVNCGSNGSPSCGLALWVCCGPLLSSADRPTHLSPPSWTHILRCRLVFRRSSIPTPGSTRIAYPWRCLVPAPTIQSFAGGVFWYSAARWAVGPAFRYSWRSLGGSPGQLERTVKVRESYYFWSPAVCWATRIPS